MFWRKFDSEGYTLRSNVVKLVNDRQSKDALFMLDDDISERNPVIDSVELQELKKLMAEWEEMMIDPVFLGLSQDKEYTRTHPDRFKLEKY